MLKRYLLFAGGNFYPYGGWEDFVATSDDLEELKALCTDESPYDWGQIVDTEQAKIVCTFTSFLQRGWSE